MCVCVCVKLSGRSRHSPLWGIMDAMAAIAGVISLTHTYRAWGTGDKWLWDSLSAINKPLAADEWDWSAALCFYFTSLHLLRFGSISSLILFPSGLSWSAILFSYHISLVSHYDIFFSLLNLACCPISSHYLHNIYRLTSALLVSYHAFFFSYVVSQYLFFYLSSLIFSPWLSLYIFFSALLVSLHLSFFLSYYHLFSHKVLFCCLIFTASSLSESVLSHVYCSSHLVLSLLFSSHLFLRYLSLRILFLMSHPSFFIFTFHLISSFHTHFTSHLVFSHLVAFLMSFTLVFARFVTVCLSALIFFFFQVSPLHLFFSSHNFIFCSDFMSFLIVLSSSFVSTVSTSHLILSCFLFYLLTCLISLFSLVFMFHLLLTCCFSRVFFVFACLVALPLSGLFSFPVSHQFVFLWSCLIWSAFSSLLFFLCLLLLFLSRLSHLSCHLSQLIIFSFSHLILSLLFSHIFCSCFHVSSLVAFLRSLSSHFSACFVTKVLSALFSSRF